MAKKKVKKQLPQGVVWGLVVLVVVFLVLFFRGSLKFSSDSPTATKTFKSSEVMDFEVEVPSGFSVEEKIIRVILTFEGNSIYLDKSSTNFDDLDSYIADLDSIDRVEVIEEKTTSINSLKAVRREVVLGTGEKRLVYDIYAEGLIYTIFTDSPALYDDLDQIAKSFRYAP